MKTYKFMAIVMLCFIGGAFAQFDFSTPFPNGMTNDILTSKNFDEAKVISFDDAINGDGEIFILYALWSPDKNYLFENKIIPLRPDGNKLIPLWDEQIFFSSDFPMDLWSGFPEYGYSSGDLKSDGDEIHYFSTINAAPNLNFVLDDGDIVSLNLVYVDGDDIELVAHTRVVVKKVFDASVISATTGDELHNWYRPDESAIILRSHFSISSDGELFIHRDNVVWANSAEGLFIKPADFTRNENLYVGYNRNEQLSIACDEKELTDDMWKSIIYASPLCDESAELDNVSGVDFVIDRSVWFGDAVFSGGAPVPSSEAYSYKINRFERVCKIDKKFTCSKLRLFHDNRLSKRAKEILGLDPNTDDTDGDGLPDYLEILMNSDPTDAHTEGKAYNDYEMYLEQGMFPPLHRRTMPKEEIAPPPKRYADDANPSTTIRPITKRHGCPLQFKFQRLIAEGKLDEAQKVKRMFEDFCEFNLYGEQAMINFEENREKFHLFRRTEEWDTMMYGSLDSDNDGIPDGLEQSGRLFGGENYNNYGKHYWEEDTRLRMAYILDEEIDGLYPRDYINDSLWDEYGIVFIGTEWQYDTTLGIDGFDTDKDGLDDYSEYLWCSCPLLKHSDPTSGAPNDHDKVQHEFIPPRLDWVAGFQDWDDDSIPNGAELYYIPELGYGILDPYCRSSDWDQYSDRQEWMSWQYKNCDACPYPLDDPLPYVIRNGCHPLIPAYPVPVATNFKNSLHLPFSEIVTAARGIEGSGSLEAETEQENGFETEASTKDIIIPEVTVKLFNKANISISSNWELTNSWEVSSETEYDLGEAHLWNWFRLENNGTEPFDRNIYGDDYFKMYVDIYWPGKTDKIYSPNEIITGFDGLIPSETPETYGGSLPRYIDTYVKHELNERVGIEIEDSIENYINFERFDKLYSRYKTTDQTASGLLIIPGGGALSYGIVLGVEYNQGLHLAEEMEDDLYRSFINDFAKNKSMIVNPRISPQYNIGDGTFSCDNLCDWTAVEAAHRSYVTVMCVYPGESDYQNVIKESPYRDEIADPSDSFYTLKEFIDKYASGADGPPKIEPFTWSTDEMETLMQVGCFPNVGYDTVWIPPAGSGCDTIDCFGEWVIVSSIDTIAEPSRKLDLCVKDDSLFICGKMKLKPGDVFVINYLRDSDNDSLEDNMELVFGTNPYNPDCDFDGLYDGTEIKLGLDPLDPNSDNSYYEAKDGDEINWLDSSEGMRLPVETFDGDTINPPRASWDSVLTHSPRVDSIHGEEHYNFVPWGYNSGGYNSQNDDQYMDANLNGLADWVEHYFRSPEKYWDGRYKITWDGEESRTNPFGYVDNVQEAKFAVPDKNYKHLCDTLTLADGNRVLQIAFRDSTKDGAGMWDNCYIYFKLFNCDIDVTKDMEISYDLMPRTATGKHICVDLLFQDRTRSITDTSFVDFNGDRMHPAWRPTSIPLDEFTHVSASLAPFTGEKITAILIGYEDNPNTEGGLVHAFIDNLCIRKKNIVFTFEPSTAPPEGFNINDIIGEPQGISAFNDEPGTPVCSLAQLPSVDPHDTTDITIDTMRYGPREKVYEFAGYLDPLNKQYDSPDRYKVMFSILPENLEYIIESHTVLGYYVWNEYAPFLYYERDDLPKLVPPEAVIDLKIYNHETGETKYMLDYLDELGVDITDQWGNSYFPWERNKVDSDSDYTYRPVSGDFWRYIDVELPDELAGWMVQDVVIRYESDLPFMGDIRAYFDNVALFQRPDDVYADTFGVYVHFGDELTSAVDNNGDKIVDDEENFIHKIPSDDMEQDYVKHTYSSLLLSNDTGPWSYDVDTVSGDTTWHWYVVDEATGDTSYSWFVEFAQDSVDSSFKRAKEWLAEYDSIHTLIDVDSFSTVTFDDDDSMRNYGYESNVPGDTADIYNPKVLCVRKLDGDNGILQIKSFSDSTDSTLLFDVNQAVPCSLCTKLCLYMIYDGWLEPGSSPITLGYKISGIDGIIWFPNIATTSRTEYRNAVPDTFSSSDSTRIVESVWVKADSGAEGYIDNFMLRRTYIISFEPNDPEGFVANNLKYSENADLSHDTCDIFGIGDIGPTEPTPTNGDHYLKISGEVTGFSPCRFGYDFWELDVSNELMLTANSELEFSIFYNFEFPAIYGNAVVDLHLKHLDGSDSWLSQYYVPDEDGVIYAPQLRQDQIGHWNRVKVHFGSYIPPNSTVDKIAIHFDAPSVIVGGHYDIYLDDIVIKF